MLVYWSIFIYTTIVSIIVKSNSNKTEYFKSGLSENIIAAKRVGIFGAFITFFLLIYFSGNRCDVSDSSAYMGLFYGVNGNLEDIPSVMENNGKGPLFSVFIIICRKVFNMEWQEWFITISVFHGFCVAKFLGKFSDDFSFSSYLFIADTSFYWLLNGIRQFTAVCIVLLFIDFFFKRNLVIFLLSVYAAYFIHDSVAIWVLFGLFTHWKPFDIKAMLAIVAAALFFARYINNDLDSNENYAGYSEQMEEDDGINIVSVLLYSIPPGIAFIKRKTLLAVERPYYIDIMVNLSVSIFVLSVIGMFTSGILIGRLPIYFSMCNLVLLPWLIENCFSAGEEDLIKKGCYIGYFCYFIYFCYISNSGLTYHSISLHISLYGG